MGASGNSSRIARAILGIKSSVLIQGDSPVPACMSIVS